MSMALSYVAALRSRAPKVAGRDALTAHLADLRGRAPLLAGQVAVGVAFLALWQATYSLQLVDPLVARSPGEVFGFLAQLFGSGRIWPALTATLSATLLAFVLGALVGTVAGICLGLFPTAERLLAPYLSAINAMPRIAFAPVFVLFFGIDQAAKVALAFTLVVFIVMVAARSGIHAVDRDVRLMATVLDVTKLQMFFKILLPSAVPSIFAGLRLGLVYALLGVITSELISARVGLGQLIAEYSSTFQLEGVYAVVIVLALIASALNGVMGLLEARFLKNRT